MENILSSILSQIDDQSLQTIGKKANATPNQAKTALASAIPILINALAKNSNSPEGVTSLQKAVAKDHDGSIFDHLGASLEHPETLNGQGILKHLLGGRQQNVKQYISNDSGLSSSSTAKILEMAAPIVMGYLGKKSGSGGGIVDLLTSYLNTEKRTAPQSQSIINQILDRNNDGNIMDDITELGTSFLSQMMKKKN